MDHLRKDSNTIKSPLPLSHKVIIIGDINVGKTCLLLKFCDHPFPEKAASTIGFDFYEKVISISSQNIKLQLWDTAGSERYRGSLMPHYYRNTAATIIVFDVTNRSSFENLHFWINETLVHTPGSIPTVLVGNKCDIELREVSDDEAQTFADRLTMPYFAVSAKEDDKTDKVADIFGYVGEKVLESGSTPRRNTSFVGHPKTLSIRNDTGNYIQPTQLQLAAPEESSEWEITRDEGLQEHVTRRVIRVRTMTVNGIESMLEEETEVPTRTRRWFPWCPFM